MSRLSGYVLAEDPEGNRILLGSDEPLPKWANRKSIPNPKAWTEDDKSTPTAEAAAS